MSENKLWKIIDKQFISYYGGDGHKISNGECGFWLWHNKEESQKVCDKLNSILDENEQLKQRNDRQAKRLAELYELMAKKDWESLTEIIDDFCSCEEQLQRESRTYGDWND